MDPLGVSINDTNDTKSSFDVLTKTINLANYDDENISRAVAFLEAGRASTIIPELNKLNKNAETAKTKPLAEKVFLENSKITKEFEKYKSIQEALFEDKEYTAFIENNNIVPNWCLLKIYKQARP